MTVMRSAFPSENPHSAPASRFVAETGAGAGAVPRPCEVVELATVTPDVRSAEGSLTWYMRGQNFCVALSRMVRSDPLIETDILGEHAVLVLDDDVVVRVQHRSGAEAALDEPGLIIVPAGASSITADRDCSLLRVFSARAAQVLARALNAGSYQRADPAVAPLPPFPATSDPHAIRVHLLRDVPADPRRFGRIFRTDSLMLNWFLPQDGPRGTDQLSPHSHNGFEQGSVTLHGDYMHHFRTPWTPRLREWRADEHLLCRSPSVAIIPPGIVHTTRAVGAGTHHLVDVFAPPRADFADKGWVLNAAEYAPRAPEATPRGTRR